MEPNDYTYQALISACGKAGQWEAAEALFEVCGASGVQPDFLLYGTLMSAYEKGAQWERAEALFEQMVAAGAWVAVGSVSEWKVMPCRGCRSARWGDGVGCCAVVRVLPTQGRPDGP